MTLTFLPGGAILAIAVLGGALAAFGLAVRAMDRTLGAARASVLPGLISGFRDWTDPAAPEEGALPRSTNDPLATPPAAWQDLPESWVIEEGTGQLAPLERVRRGSLPS